MKTVKIRRDWTINPRTRVKGSSKVYNRAKLKLETRREDEPKQN
jgi:hypothetical protein